VTNQVLQQALQGAISIPNSKSSSTSGVLVMNKNVAGQANANKEIVIVWV